MVTASGFVFNCNNNGFDWLSSKRKKGFFDVKYSAVLTLYLEQNGGRLIVAALINCISENEYYRNI